MELESEVAKRSAFQRPPPRSPYPWLVYPHSKNYRRQTFCTLLSEPNNIRPLNQHVRSIPELRNTDIWSAGHGWLVLERNEKLHLWNPMTLESIPLPPLQIGPKEPIAGMVLTSPPSDPDSTLMVFVWETPIIAFCRISDRDQAWTERRCDEEIKEMGNGFRRCFYNPILCNNRIYASGPSPDDMVEIEIVKPKRLVMRPIKSDEPSYQFFWPRSESCLVESGEEIFKIRCELGGVGFEEIINILIFKLDFSKKMWKPVMDCQDRAIFWSTHDNQAISTTISGDSVQQLMGNRVYFTRRQDKALYIYNIKEKSISKFIPDIPTPWKEPIWVLPDAHLASTVDDHQYQCNSVVQEQGGKGDMDIRLFSVAQGDCQISNQETSGVSFSGVYFHPDILENISRHLSFDDYMNFRTVSTVCRSVAPAKQWTKLSGFVGLENHIPSPWLMLPTTAQRVSSLVDPRLGCKHKYKITTPPLLEDARILYSNHGWLLMSNLHFEVGKWSGKKSLILYNPMTKTTISLPNMDYFSDHFFFTSLPQSPDCVVVGISIYPAEIKLLRRGMDQWITIEYTLEDVDCHFWSSHFYPVLVDGSFFFLGQNGKLGVIKLDEFDITFRVLKPKSPCRSCEQNFLVECDGELLSVFVGKAEAEEWVQVFKLNQSAMAWERVRDLGKNSLYVSGGSAVASKAKIPEMANKIYFPRFFGDSILYYSMETGRFHSSESKEIQDPLMIYNGAREQLCCCWFEPRWHSEELQHSTSSFALNRQLDLQ